MYSQPVTDEERQWSGELETQWKDLAAKARQRDRDIIPDKRRFTVVSFCIVMHENHNSLRLKQPLRPRFLTNHPMCRTRFGVMGSVGNLHHAHTTQMAVFVHTCTLYMCCLDCIDVVMVVPADHTRASADIPG